MSLCAGLAPGILGSPALPTETVPAQVLYAGLVGAGLYQFNVVVPRVPAGDQAVVAELGGLKTQPGRFINVE